MHFGLLLLVALAGCGGTADRRTLDATCACVGIHAARAASPDCRMACGEKGTP